MLDLLIITNVCWVIAIVAYIVYKNNELGIMRNSRDDVFDRLISVVKEKRTVQKQLLRAEEIIYAHNNVIGLVRDKNGRFKKKENLSKLKLQYEREYGIKK